MSSFKAFIFFTFISVVFDVNKSDNVGLASVDVGKFLRAPNIRFKNFVPDFNLLNKLTQPKFEGNLVHVRDGFTKWNAPVDYERKANNELHRSEFPNQRYSAHYEPTEENFRNNEMSSFGTRFDNLNNYYLMANQITTEITETTTDTSTADIETTTDYDDDDIMTRLSSSAVASLLG